jgi:hypothetical protein
MAYGIMTQDGFFLHNGVPILFESSDSAEEFRSELSAADARVVSVLFEVEFELESKEAPDQFKVIETMDLGEPQYLEKMRKKKGPKWTTDQQLAARFAKDEDVDILLNKIRHFGPYRKTAAVIVTL